MEKLIDRECSTHGYTIFSRRKSGKYRCRKCSVDAVTKRRRKIKQLAVDYKGGKCIKCNYDKCIDALEFHHTDPTKKDFGISHKGFTRSWKVIREELDKCILVCSNCHKEIHAEINSTVAQSVDAFDC